MAKGWIKDRYYRVAPLSVTVGTESSDVITVSLALVNQDGDAIEEARIFHAEVLDANAELSAATSYTIDVGATAVTTDTRPSVIFALGTDGTLDIDVTDVLGAADETVYLKLTPLNKYGATVYTALTFDAS